MLSRGALLGHYRISEKIGAGGMGEIYRAHDEQLDRDVALKLLPDETFTDPVARARLLREARAAAGLNHPHICTIYEVGEAAGQAYIAMELIEGEMLSARLARGALGPEQVLRYGVHLAEALAHAHQRGVVHRDLKSANIVVTAEGQAKVLDFGLAKRLSGEELAEAATQSLAPLTEPGVLVGTLAYMAPEQLRGQPADACSDVWALGVVLYEMATGRRPFQGQTGFELSSAILNRRPPSLPAAVPLALRAVIERCLEKEPGKRYAGGSEVRAALEAVQTGTVAPWEEWRYRLSQRRWLGMAGVLVLLVLGVIVGGLRERLFGPPAPPAITSLAVLPLENLSGDPAQEYFADGMTEALINNLARLRALRVIARASVMRYKGTNKPLPEIARQLNVNAIITGSVQRSGERVRVTVQLINAATDTHLWARDYERDLTDVLKLQREVARAIANEIHIQVTGEERVRLASPRSVNPQAYEAYLLGRYHSSKNNAQDWTHAVEHFQRAIRLGPDYAEAYAGLSEALLQQGVFAVEPAKENVPRARDAALKAIELDEQLAEAHTALGNVKYYHDWDWAGAEKEFERALELNPASLSVHIAYGHLLHSLGRHDEAVKEGQIAVQLDPLSSEAPTALGRFLYRARRYEEALPILKRAVQLEPRSIGANTRLGSVYAELGRYTEALAVYEKAKELAPSVEGYQDVIAYVYARMGRKEEARRMVSGMKEFPIDVAGVYAALDDKDEAFRILEEAIEERKQQLVALKEDPTLENLHSDPRWKELLRRMNFPAE